VIAISLVVLYNNYRYFKQWLYELGTIFRKMFETVIDPGQTYLLRITKCWRGVAVKKIWVVLITETRRK
jgi:hypothetical protein